MEFKIALSTVILTLLYIVPGYVLCKSKKASGDHLATLSAILLYILAPCMEISSFIAMDYSFDNLKLMAGYFVASFLIQCLFMGLLFLIFKRKFEQAKYRIMNIGMVLGNVGFFGLPIVKALFPDNPEVMCYSSIHVISMNILVFTMGVYCLTAKKEYMTVKKAILNPAVIGMFIAVPLYITGAGNYLPDMMINAVKLLGNMTTPVCMLILGVRLATVEFKKLFMRPEIYLICLGKMIIFPLFSYCLVYFLPIPYSFKACIVVLSGTPCASVILNLAEIHHSEMELSANCILVSTLLSFITIPLITLLL